LDKVKKKYRKSIKFIKYARLRNPVMFESWTPRPFRGEAGRVAADFKDFRLLSYPVAKKDFIYIFVSLILGQFFVLGI
jgi:hypothetical protein